MAHVIRAICHARLSGGTTIIGQTGLDITSLTDGGAGDATANFGAAATAFLGATTVMPQVSLRVNGGTNLNAISVSPDTASCRMLSYNSGNTGIDPTEFQLSVYRIS